MYIDLNPDSEQSRYDRQERITWWDQSALLNSRVLVVGAGALGNEIVKNLVLLGIGSIHILDMDLIERSNLARCALFRDEHEGLPKASALAEAASKINPDCIVTSDVISVQKFGSASLRNFDVIIAGLDNMEARLWLNRASRHLGLYWIDGAIEGLQGIVRAFPPSGACLECTLSEQDHINLSHRRSCALLSPEELISGKTPTNSTSASVVAGLEVQEAIKYLVGRTDLLALNNMVWRIDGETMHTSTMGFFEDEYCLSHDTYIDIADDISGSTSWENISSLFEAETGEQVLAIDFEDDIILVAPCADCAESTPITGLRSLVPTGAGRCETCGAEREVEATSSMTLAEATSHGSISNWLWPLSEFITIRGEIKRLHIPITKENSDDR